ncbi:hypothetical protein D7Y05_01405 [bacterium 1XD42-54]|nr:hypothetical protein D7Y05_01405 [bacterium 1XD42-54]
MNKKLKRILSVIIFSLLTGLLSINASAAKISSSKVNSLYRAFLTKKTVKIPDKYYDKVSLKGAYFTTVDIDGNGIKELIVKEKFGASNMPCQPLAYIFTVKNKKVVYVGSAGIKQDYSKSVQISKKYKAIYARYQVASYMPHHFYTIKNYKLTNKIFLYAQYGYGKDKYGSIPSEPWCKSSGYFINKKKVSKSRYDSEYKKYMKSLKTYTLSANTAANRKKKLK